MNGNPLVAHVCFYRETGEWSVGFVRTGREHQVCFSRAELFAIEVLYRFLADAASRAPVDPKWIGRGQKIELREGNCVDGWWIGEENVA